MSFYARIHDLTKGQFLQACEVDATDLHTAESTVIHHAAQALSRNPHDMDVRHLHECAKSAGGF